MKIEKTNQGLYELYLWDKSSEVPKGIETSCVVLNKTEMDEMRRVIQDYDE